jgi:hypothetical protein
MYAMRTMPALALCFQSSGCDTSELLYRLAGVCRRLAIRRVRRATGGIGSLMIMTIELRLRCGLDQWELVSTCRRCEYARLFLRIVKCGPKNLLRLSLLCQTPPVSGPTLSITSLPGQGLMNIKERKGNTYRTAKSAFFVRRYSIYVGELVSLSKCNSCSSCDAIVEAFRPTVSTPLSLSHCGSYPNRTIRAFGTVAGRMRSSWSQWIYCARP